MTKLSPHHHFASFFKNEKDLQPYAYAASKNLAEGSICIDTNGNPKRLFENYLEEEDFTNLTSDQLRELSLVGNENDVKKPFVLHGDNFYITRYFNYETQILKRIETLIYAGNEKRKERFKRLKELSAFKALKENQDIKEGADWQLVAAIMAFVNNFSIITGGPGTGKTISVAKILSLLYEENPELLVKLAAPTGKAAMRMKESLQGNSFIPEEFKVQINDLEPHTLHRLLGSIYQSPYFKHNSENPVEADVIIVDEASMIDVGMFAKLISAIDKKTKLILLGDKNQLASVEAGSLLGDLCASVENLNCFSQEFSLELEQAVSEMKLDTPENSKLLQDHITELKYSWRFEETPEFREVSQAVIRYEKENIQQWFVKGGLQGNIQVDAEYSEQLFKDFIQSFEAYFPKESETTFQNIAGSLQAFNEIRILAVIKKGKQGVAGLNARVENYLTSKELLQTTTEFYEHRPVMVTRNHPDLGLFNGDVGIVRQDPENSTKLKIWFLASETQSDGEVTEEEKQDKGLVRGYSPALLTDVETVFAMTVHKSQGSEFEKVLLVMPKAKELPLLTRELLYTGITRAKNQLLLQGTEEVVLQAAKAQVKRASGITNRI
jgi:exodeoxyribonuclease V alpha subunit